MGVSGGAWLQIVLIVLVSEGTITNKEYFISVGMLASMRHSHIWLNTTTLIGMLLVDDERAFRLYEASLHLIGASDIDLNSYLKAALDLLRRIWATPLAEGHKMKALGCLLDQIVNSYPADRLSILHILDRSLYSREQNGDALAWKARNYLESWMVGHFMTWWKFAR